MNRPRAILLDFYGTVVAEDDDVVAAVCRSIQRTATARVDDPAAIGRHWSDVFARLCAAAAGPAFATQRELERRSLRDTIQRFGSDADEEPLSRRLFDYWRRPALLPDAAAFLAEIGVPVCLVSNIDRADLDAAIDAHGLRVDAVVTSEQARAYKPRPEPFRLALDHLGLAPGEAWHVGDSLTADVAGANALGIPVVWVNRRRRHRPAWASLTAEVTDLASVGELVR
ncbi:HAD family hydrolase [Frankia gtarii]|uniref:HAD family hydrolase n=1 Tax=Frankia gtarii TaxID=2950102 RepID=UPI0021C015F3|nr:HAD family hydrolase [Frankia gtarii]